MNEEILDPFIISEQQFDKTNAFRQHLQSGLIDFLKQPRYSFTANFSIKPHDWFRENIPLLSHASQSRY